MEIKPPKGVLSNEEMRAWTYPRPARLIWDLSAVWLQVLLSVALYLHYPTPAVFLLAVVLIGGAQHGCALIAHEGAHYLLIPQNRRLNDIVSRWLFASPVLLPFSTYRRRHMDHHRHVSTEDDTKELYKRGLRGWRFPMEVVRSLTGLDFLSQVVTTLRDYARKRGSKPAAAGGGMASDLVLLAASQLSLLGLFALWDWRLYFALWVLPLLTVLQLFSKLRSATEHQPYDSEVPVRTGPYFKGTPIPWLRSVQSTPIEGLFLTRINFQYHAEHHLWPQVCYQYLPILSQRLRERADFHQVVFEGSYCSVIWKLARGQ